MTFNEFLGTLLGPVARLVDWLIDWIPLYEIVQIDEIGVSRFLGKEAKELKPGVHWYCPNLTDINKHHTSRMTMPLEGLSLETEDGQQCQISMVITYFITDVITFDVRNYDADDSMEDVAEASLRDAVMEHTWEELRKPTDSDLDGDGRRLLEKKLSSRVQKAVDRFGVTVETVRPRDQVRLRAALRLFGNDADNSVNLSSG